jgi:16S rRNA (uracil1498-N3)-methyltransferase
MGGGGAVGAMKRLFVPRLAEGPLALTGEDHHYLAHVLRATAGDEVVLFDGRGGEARARVGAVTAEAIALAVGEVRRAPPPRLELTLLVALLKGEKMDLVVQKTTELGVARIVPVLAERSVVRLDPGRAGARIARWDKIATEAARQSGRADAPGIALPEEAGAAFARAAGFRVLFHERSDVPLRRVLPEAPPAQAAIAIGPEGGFTEAEIQAATAAGFVVCGLGPRILRAETAAIAALAIIAFSVGDLA